jgi:signal transduction histidine kinase
MTPAQSNRHSANSLIVWVAIGFSLVYAVTMADVPYVYEEVNYSPLYAHIRLLGVLFGISAILLLLPRICPPLAWLDLPARLVFFISLGILWWQVAFTEKILGLAIAFGLLGIGVLVDWFRAPGGSETFFWVLAIGDLAYGLVILLSPASIPAPVVGYFGNSLPLLGGAFVLGGLVLLGTTIRSITDYRCALATLVAMVPLVVLAAGLAYEHQWFALQNYILVIAFGLVAVFWPRMHPESRLALRLIRAFILAVLLPLLVLGSLSSYLLQQKLVMAAFAANLTLVRGAATIVSQYVEGAEATARLVASQPGFTTATASWDLASLEQQLRLLYDESGRYQTVVVVDPTGIVRVAYPPDLLPAGTSVAASSTFQQAVRGRAPAIGLMSQPERTDHHLLIAYAVPVIQPPASASSPLLGVLVTSIDLGPLSRFVDTSPAGEVSRVILVDRTGRVIMEHNATSVGQPFDPTDVAVQLARTGQSGLVEYVDENGQRQLAAYAFVPELGWALVAVIPMAEALQQITQLTLGLLGLMGLAALITIGLASLVAIRITRPLEVLEAAAHALSEGDVGHRVDIRTGDELEDLANSFNLLASNLQQRGAEVMQLLHREEAFARIGQALVQELELPKVLDVVIAQSLSVLDVDAVAVWVADPARRTLALLAQRHFTSDTAQAFADISYTAPFVASEAARTEQPQFVEDASARAAPSFVLQVYEREGIRSILALPLCSRGHLVGVVEYATRAVRQFAPSDREFYSTVADLFAVALENARLYERVSQALRLREDFISAAAHELRTPVTVIRGRTQLTLLKDAREETARRTLETVLKQSDRIADLAEDLFTVVRLRPGLVALRREPFDLTTLVRDVVGQFAESAVAHRFELSAPERLWVDADYSLIREVLNNLIESAVQYAPSEGTIKVSAWRVDAEAVVSVTEPGIKIAPERQPYVFEPFYEPIPPGEPGYSGRVSLALYASKQIIDAHRGHIWLASPTEGGATFSFSLPIGGEFATSRSGEIDKTQNETVDGV